MTTSFRAPRWLSNPHLQTLTAALPIWIEFMQAALAGRPEVQLPRPPGLATVRIDPDMVPDRKGGQTAQRQGRSPRQLFGDYLDARGTGEEGVRELFDELYDEVSSKS